MALTSYVKDGDWQGLRRILQGLNQKLDHNASPTWENITIDGLVANSIIYANAAQQLDEVTVGTGLTWSAPTLSINASEIDHGSLAGLADDDHSIYHTDARAATWLAANHETTYNHADIALNTTHRSSTGVDHGYIDQDVQTTASPTFVDVTLTGLLTIPATTTTAGIIYQGAATLLHTYAHATADGENFFMGSSAGNFTSSPGGGASFLSSYNLSIGGNTLKNLTTGYFNIGLGNFSGFNITTGFGNVGIGSGTNFTCAGGHDNIAIGQDSLRLNQSGNFCTAIGDAALYNCTGDNNVGLGAAAGDNVTSGIGNVVIGPFIDAASATTNYQLNICNVISGIWAGNQAIDVTLSGTGTFTAGDGGATNYTEVNVTGDIKPKGSATIILQKAAGTGIKVDQTTPTFGFRDLLGEVTTRNTGGTKPAFAVYNGAIRQFQFSNGDEEYFEFHIPHDHVPGTDIFLHIHWSQTSATITGGTVDFRHTAIYAKGYDQAAFNSTPITKLFTSADAGTTQYQHHITEIQISAATPTAGEQFDTDDLEPDGVLLVTLEMDANNLTNSGAVLDPFIHYADIHYQSTNMATKDKNFPFYT